MALLLLEQQKKGSKRETRTFQALKMPSLNICPQNVGNICQKTRAFMQKTSLLTACFLFDFAIEGKGKTRFLWPTSLVLATEKRQ